MKNKTVKILFVIIMFIFVLAFLKTIVFAGDKLNPEDYHHTVSTGDAPYIFDKGGELLRVLRNIAAVTSVLALSIIGVRYMVGSVEQKAEYKQTMLPVAIGCFLVGSLSINLTLIQSIAA